jgi:two-component system phosphate regulon sensor histidine kinase PhoR
MEFLLIFNYFIFAGLYQIQNINFTALAILAITNTVGLIFYFLNKNNQNISSPTNKTNSQTIVSSKSYSSEDIENQLINEIEDYILFINSFNAISAANKAAKSFYGDIIGKNLSSFLRAPDLLDKIEKCRDERVNEYLEFEINLPTYSFFRLTIVPLSQKNVLIVVKDYTDVKKSEQLRSDFVANVSHELKTPLVSIKGFLETISNSAKDDPKAQEKFIKIMQEQANKMEILILDLMSLSRIEMQEHIQPDGKVDMKEIISNIQKIPNKILSKKNININFKIEDNLPFVRGDYDKLSEVVQNIYDNAIKYTKENTTIDILLKSNPEKFSNGSVFLSIKDEGIGIAKEEIHRVTERFYRSANAKKNMIQGTGLGLAIVKHIVNQHRGELEINSRLNEGSEFIIHLPLYETSS